MKDYTSVLIGNEYVKVAMEDFEKVKNAILDFYNFDGEGDCPVLVESHDCCGQPLFLKVSEIKLVGCATEESFRQALKERFEDDQIANEVMMEVRKQQKDFSKFSHN